MCMMNVNFPLIALLGKAALLEVGRLKLNSVVSALLILSVKVTAMDHSVTFSVDVWNALKIQTALSTLMACFKSALTGDV